MRHPYRPRTILRRLTIRFALAGLPMALCLADPAPGVSPDLARDIQAIRAVGSEGRGNVEATAALRRLAALGGEALPGLLAGMDGAGPLAANWLRGAVETIADREPAGGTNSTVPALGRFLLETRNDARARALAFELLSRADPATADKLLAGMLNDPSPDLRHGAVRKLVEQAAQTLAGGNKAGARVLLGQALASARQAAQIDAIATQLRDLGEPVDLPATFGFLMRWHVIGPFDSTGGAGFAHAYPPEERLDSNAQYDGKLGPVKWRDYTTTNEHGAIDMNQPFTPLKAAAAYAWTEFFSEADQDVELRLASENAWKLWLNGGLVFGQNEYHLQKAIDQYVMNVRLRRGPNTILVKVCQNEQTEDWAGGWDFHLRICDRTGATIRAAAPPAAAAAGPSAGSP